MIQENQKLLNQLNVISDGVIVFLSFLAGYCIRFFVLQDGIRFVPFRSYVIVGLLLIPLHLITYLLFGMYESYRKKRLYQELGTLFAANALDFLLLQVALFLTRNVDFSRKALFIFFAAAYGLLGVKRIAMRKYLHRLRREGKNLKHLVLIGCGESSRRVSAEICSSAFLGYAIDGYVSDTVGELPFPHLGDFSQLDGILLARKPDEAIAGLSIEEYRFMPDIIRACEHSGTKLSLVPYYAQYLPTHPQLDSLNGIPLINLRRIPLDNLANAFMKRTVDVLGSLVLIVLFSPLMLFAALGVKLSSPGPIIFRQKRVGLNKKEFCMYKFRSMRVNAASDTGWSTNDDPRKTKFGSFIRKYSIDELPQFFNVLKGDMSLVGPRPEVPFFVERFKDEIPLYMVKHQVRPGITGWAQVNGLRGDTSIERRIAFDVFYIENWTLLLDIKILFMTVFKGFVNEEHLA